MLFYDLSVIEQASLGSSKRFIGLLYRHYTNSIPKTFSHAASAPKGTVTGHSFLLNPQDFFKDYTTDLNHKIQYLKLSARRDYSMYKLYGYKGLHRSFFPDLNYDAIKHNPLLTITKTDIFFKYEETK